MPTPHLGLPYIEAAQAQKHITHNEALDRLDAVVQLAVESHALTSPPGSPDEGDCYIVAEGATDAWADWDFDIACFSGGGWIRIAARAGMKAWVKSERLTVTYEDGAWRDGIALTAHGGRVTLRAAEEELTLVGAFVESAADFIPDRAIVLGVASRTTEAVTGATSYDVGLAGEPDKFGALLGASLGATNVGVIGPTAFYVDTPVRVTANGADFTGGKIRLIAYYVEMTAPVS